MVHTGHASLHMVLTSLKIGLHVDLVSASAMSVMQGLSRVCSMPCVCPIECLALASTTRSWQPGTHVEVAACTSIKWMLEPDGEAGTEEVELACCSAVLLSTSKHCGMLQEDTCGDTGG